MLTLCNFMIRCGNIGKNIAIICDISKDIGRIPKNILALECFRRNIYFRSESANDINGSTCYVMLYIMYTLLFTFP